MNNCAAQLPDHEDRRQPRTHLFVLATLYSEAGSAPVHIRNMSSSGALLEGGVLPAPGSRISLRRGALHASGRIAWRSDRRAGVSLEAAIHVADWMSRGGSLGQQRVDAIVAGCKAEAQRPYNATPLPTRSQPVSIEIELTKLRVELAQLEEALSEDASLVATHPEIQTIDISRQRVDRLLEHLRAGG